MKRITASLILILALIALTIPASGMGTSPKPDSLKSEAVGAPHAAPIPSASGTSSTVSTPSTSSVSPAQIAADAATAAALTAVVAKDIAANNWLAAIGGLPTLITALLLLISEIMGLSTKIKSSGILDWLVSIIKGKAGPDA